jgi:hypothetical protein
MFRQPEPAGSRNQIPLPPEDLRSQNPGDIESPPTFLFGSVYLDGNLEAVSLRSVNRKERVTASNTCYMKESPRKLPRGLGLIWLTIVIPQNLLFCHRHGRRADNKSYAVKNRD